MVSLKTGQEVFWFGFMALRCLLALCVNIIILMLSVLGQAEVWTLFFQHWAISFSLTQSLLWLPFFPFMWWQWTNILFSTQNIMIIDLHIVGAVNILAMQDNEKSSACMFGFTTLESSVLGSLKIFLSSKMSHKKIQLIFVRQMSAFTKKIL